MNGRKILTGGLGQWRWTGALSVVGVLIGVLPSGVAAQRGRAELNDGNRLYEEGRFGEAHEKYLEALRDAPGLPLALFNDGNALYESEEYVRALDAYRGAIESGDPALAAATWYNLGNALYRQQRFQESLEAYKEALRIDSGEIDYKHNLELALEQLQEQEQDQGSEDAEGNQQDEEEQENQDGEQDQEPQDQEENQGEEDQEQDPDESPNRDQPPEGSPEEEQPESDQQPEPEPGEMTPEEAERLLRGVQEDPDEVNRRQAPLRGRRPTKPW
jgi:tetratricopeptide (TPR) repeat protein